MSTNTGRQQINTSLLQALQLRASANRAALARRQADARAIATAQATNNTNNSR